MFLSDLVNVPIRNKNRQMIGRVVDAIVTDLTIALPRITGFVVSRGFPKREFFIPIEDVKDITAKAVHLNTNTIDASPFVARSNEILLTRDILDKQIVDISERTLTRTNDIDLSYSKGHLFVKSADVSFRAILHRLGLPTWGFVLKYNAIPWRDIQFLGTNLPVKVKMDYDRLETLHPAAIAEFIFKGPGVRQGTKIIQSLEEDIAADVIESMPLAMQVTLLEGMKEEHAATILSQMESHHAADLLAKLSSAKKNRLLSLMEEQKARDAASLLTYPQGSAGALMQVEYLTFPRTMTVEEARAYLHSAAPLPEFLLYFFITESIERKKLVGIVTIWDFFKAEPRVRMEHIMEKDIVSVGPLDEGKKALRLMTQYDISAIPILNDRASIIGIVTLSHALKLIIPKRWQTRATLRE